MSFEDALASANVVAAWDLDPSRDATLSIFDVSRGARQIAWKAVPPTAAQRLTSDLVARGIRVGHYDGHHPFVWVVAPEAITVWSREGVALQARDGIVTNAIGRTLASTDIAAFVGYLDDHLYDRGIKAETRAGARVTVIDELSPAASNPTYDRVDVLADTHWIHTLGAELARWVHVAFRDDV